jgi:hypothetical protein
MIPLKSRSIETPRDLLGDRTLGRPHAGRARPEELLVVGQRALNLHPGVLGVDEPARGQMDVRRGDLRQVRVVEQRHDRVVERRGREFDPSLARKLPVLGDDEGHDLALFPDEKPLFLLGEA